MDGYTLAYVHVNASRHLPVEKTISPTESVFHVDSQESLEFRDWTTKSPSVGARERRKRPGLSLEATRRKRGRSWSPSCIDNFSFVAYVLFPPPPFHLSLPFFPLARSLLSLLSALPTFSSAREVLLQEVRQRHPRGLPRAQPSLGVPRGQTSSQKLRYVGRSTASSSPRTSPYAGDACVAFKPTPKPTPYLTRGYLFFPFFGSPNCSPFSLSSRSLATVPVTIYTRYDLRSILRRAHSPRVELLVITRVFLSLSLSRFRRERKIIFYIVTLIRTLTDEGGNTFRDGNTVAKNIEIFPRPTSFPARLTFPTYIPECINSLVTRDFSPVRKKKVWEKGEPREYLSILVKSGLARIRTCTCTAIPRSGGPVRLRQECRWRMAGVGGAIGGHGGESVRPQRAFRKLPLTRDLIRSPE